MLPAGTVLRDKYRIDRVLGVGGMAVVYSATHRNRKRFAIKVLHAELSLQHDIRSRFVREGYVANTVDHPNVVAVLDDDVAEDGSPFLVMELLDGVSAEALGSVPTGRLPVGEVLCIADQLLDVLGAAHEKSIIHRDVKPANLFLLRTGQLKVLDFGIARLREASTTMHSTRTGTTLGTPAYVAPEQALGLTDQIDARTDLWSVGATLFRMLAGRPVHEGDNARQVLVQSATKPAPSLGRLAPDVPEAVVDVVDRALAFDRTRRWDSAALMRAEIQQVHRDLFGEFDREPLAALVDESLAVMASLPTERLPEIGSSRPPPPTTAPAVPHPSPLPRRDVDSDRVASRRFGDSGEVTAPPGAMDTPAGVRTARRGRSSLVLVGALAGLLGVVLVVALGTERPVAEDTAASSASGAYPQGTSALAPARPDRLVESSREEKSTPAPSVVRPPALASAETARTHSRLEENRKSIERARTRPTEPQATARATSQPDPTPAPSARPVGPTPRRDPLDLELQ